MIFSEMRKKDAVIRNIEIIGEAVKNISVKLKEKYRDVEGLESFPNLRTRSCKCSSMLLHLSASPNCRSVQREILGALKPKWLRACLKILVVEG